LRKALFLLFASILLGCGKQERVGISRAGPAPDAKLIASIEALAKNSVAESDFRHEVKLSNISNFSRYYTFRTDKGRQYIWGELYPNGPRELHIVDSSHMRYIFDGGCGAVSLYYDIKAAKIVSIQCHGMA
jgi:hypothetical protein